MEKWMDIKDFEGLYQISNYGRVFSIRSQKLIKHTHDDRKYCITRLSVDGKLTRIKLHKLVATYFIANPYNKPQINHKDGNKENNHYENLEWCTQLENLQHAYATGLNTNKPPKAIQMLDKDGILIREFYSIHEAQRETGAEPTNIVKVCKGKRKTHNGYVWRYKDGD